jgi:glycosyltransferase involved in cell wall biosynthesis
VIRAFNELGLPLVIVGTGSQEKKLKRMAHRNIKFVGQLTDRELAYYYRKSRALIFAQEEDFGLVAVEAQSFGIPVIAYKAGGALDIVTDGKTGVFFTKQTKKSLIAAVKRVEKIKFNKNVIIKNAKKFSQKRFEKQFQGFIKKSFGEL